MAVHRFYLRLMALAALLLLFALRDASSDSLNRILQRRDVSGAVAVPSKSSLSVPASRAQDFLSVPASRAQDFLSRLRTRRNVWDRSRPDVQQWIMQFMYMGFDEQRLEADLSYWLDQARSRDQGRQHHYDENAPIGPRDSHRHGADVNYDYY